jgi:hypothetical protein
MKRTLLVIGFLGFATCLTTVAHAGVMFEPYIGYEVGNYEGGNGINKTSNSTSSSESGMAYGARLGYMTMLGFGFGAEYMGTSLSLSNSGSSTQSGSDIGAYLEFKFPAFLKIYATYFVSSSASITNQTSNFSGNGEKVGIGITTLPFININFEIVNRDFSKEGSQTLSTDLKDSDYCVNISIPIP